METKSPEKPRQGYRRTSVYLRNDQWNRLKSVEEQTGASPSFTLRKLIDAMPTGKKRNTPAA